MLIGRLSFFVKAGLLAGALFLLPSGLWAQGGSLTVGTKVIYPGGADQPPKEKDTGVTFKVGNIHGSVGNGETVQVSYDQEAAWQGFLDEGNPGDLLESLRGKSDPLASTYRVLAYIDLDRPADARREAEKAIRDPHFPEELKTRIEDALPPSDSDPGTDESLSESPNGE